jgi:hypothetical protein
MAGALPPLPPELAHLTPDQQKMIFGRVVGTGEWATPTVAAYNQTVGHLQGYVDERPQSGTFIGGMEGVIQHPTYTPPTQQPSTQQPSTQQPSAPPPDPMQRLDIRGQEPYVPGVGEPPGGYQKQDFQGQAPVVDGAPQQYQRPEFQSTPAEQFQGTMPAPQMMSLEEMMDVVGRRADLAYDGQVAGKERALEEEMLRGEQTKGDIAAAYAKAQEDLRKAGQSYQQGAANTMRARGIYDSGLAVETSNRIYLSMLKNNMEISSTEAKALSDLAEYLDLRSRHSSEEIQQMMGEKALFAQSLLDEMHMRNQDRRDMLAQQEFENWLATQHYQMQNEQAQRQEYWNSVGFDAQQVQQEYDRWFNDAMFEWQKYESQLNEYWRQTSFDAQMAEQEYQRYWDQVNHSWNQHLAQMDQYRWSSEFDARQNDAAWQRIDSMNRWEMEMELARLQYNNQLSQQEFNNAMALTDQAMKEALYKAQYG